MKKNVGKHKIKIINHNFIRLRQKFVKAFFNALNWLILKMAGKLKKYFERSPNFTFKIIKESIINILNHSRTNWLI